MRTPLLRKPQLGTQHRSAPHWPRPLTSIGATIGAGVALAPGSLPRGALVTGLLLAAFVGVGALIGRIAGIRAPGSPRSRRYTGWVCAGLATGLFAQMLWWQSELRAHLDMSPPGIWWVLGALGPSALLAAICCARARTRAVFAALAAAVLLPMMPSPAGAAEPARSPAEKFVSTDATPTSLRIYGELDTRDVRVRAAEAVQRWQASGGLGRHAVVVAVPTGSGWVDPDAVNGFESRFGGDVSVITLQYSDIPSWQAFVSSPQPARDSAVALTESVAEVVGRIPVDERPQIYIYGQSLGAIGADAARRWADDNAPTAICHTVLAGAPEGSTTVTAAHTTVLGNGSDPVIRWSSRLIWQPPHLPHDLRSDMPRPPWMPIASFVQASTDLIGALSYPAGYGHQYGTEQGTLAPDCGGSW
jgi:uncharacterized membrane protein